MGSSFASPETVVTTDEVEAMLGDPNVRIVEVDVDTQSFDEAHLPGAIGWNWITELCDRSERDILSPKAFAALMGRSGITPETTVILYGDNNNWFAAWALWQMKIYGHRDVRLMDGGRNKWIEEERPLTLDPVDVAPTTYTVGAIDETLRALLPDVMRASGERAAYLVDVRSPNEFSGRLLAPPGLPETCQRGGHIPGAASIPWGEVCRDDGTFKSAAELRELYASRGVLPDKPVITYCRIGERSSHSWFVLKYLLGFNDVRNYDGSWTEWGNLVRAPIER
ncbi:MAG: sulfurtransferase [Myxococcales bacterium]|nr:sulfurtransferase [Myxococcales bacterium]